MERSQVKPTSGVTRGNGFILSRDLNPHCLAIANCKPLGQQTRRHSPAQIRKLAASLERFGFVLPILTDPQGRVVAGWAMVLAAQQLGLNEVPAVRLTDLSDADLRMLRLALNRIADDAAWDRQVLALEFAEILELEPRIELESSGFEMGEIELLLDGSRVDQDDELPAIEAEATPVSRRGDLWLLGEHHLLCADALDTKSYAFLMGADKAQMMFADPPDHLRIKDRGSCPKAATGGATASAEASPSAYQAFLRTALGLAAGHSINGAIHYVCMDWRHQRELIEAGDRVYGELLNICVWTKSQAGKGSLYHSQHEFVFVFKLGKSVSKVLLRRTDQRRSDVWDYGGDNALQPGARSKPVAMIADAMRDCSDRGDLVIDPFGCYGTTLIAAEQTGRRARVIELNPILVDASIERWQRLTGGTAIHAVTGRAFARASAAGDHTND
jgi:hypothetical protein